MPLPAYRCSLPHYQHPPPDGTFVATDELHSHIIIAQVQGAPEGSLMVSYIVWVSTDASSHHFGITHDMFTTWNIV